MKVLVTGGLGFIGSETVVALYQAGHEAVIVDNLANSKEKVLDRLETLVGTRPAFYKVDCCDKAAFEEVFKKESFEAVIHFAGLKAVGESVVKPLEYYSNNLNSTLVLVDLMRKYGVRNIIFSSSATVYGTPKHVPLFESDPLGETTNPYGTTKSMIERILTDIQKAIPSFNVILLRYFNPIGAHPSGLLGEDPNGIPNNLMPYISQVSIGRLKELNVFGDDYPTPDGTGVRDYVHVLDLAEGHVAAIKRFAVNPGLAIYNLGTGKGTSVLELVHAFEKVNNIKIPYVIKPRRAGDVAENYANCDKAFNELGWKARFDIEDACRDAYNFQKKNPQGI